MLACIWGGSRYSWGSVEIAGLFAGAVLLAGALVLRERRATDPIVPMAILRGPTVAIASAVLFLVTATMFSITVFVPLFLQTTTGATPTEAGLLLIPLMAGVTASTNLAGRSIERTGRYKRFPVAGLMLIAIALGLLAALADHASQVATGVALAVFGIGFGMVGQVMMVAVQNGVERRFLGVAMASTTFFRALGGAVGAGTLGAVFAASGDVIGGVQAVFSLAAGVALVALLIVLRLREVPLQTERAASPSRRSVLGPRPVPRRAAGRSGHRGSPGRSRSSRPPSGDRGTG
jgi:predicted MFS family arabinose efflux permease